MTTAGAGSTYLVMFVTVLLICIPLGNTYEAHDPSDFVEEFSYADAHQYEFRHKRDVKTDPVEYVVVAKLTTQDLISVDTIQSFMDSWGLPILLQNSTKIVGLNVTTVCQQSGTGTQCRCENSYVWAYNNCLTYHSCDSMSSGSCGCILGTPGSGQMCIPKSELPVFDFTVQVNTNANSELVNIVKNYVQSFSFPLLVGSVLEITKVDLTTVCSVIKAGYYCQCENQYFWPCDTCLSYGSCDTISNNTCGCIRGLPSTGPYCLPITEITTNTTTVTAASTKPIKENTRTISMKIYQVFDSTLTDTSSATYIKYSSDITSSINSVYQSVLSSSYKTGSAKVIQFSPGSVRTDITIITTSDTLDFSAANTQLASVLSSKGYAVSADSFAEIVENGLYDTSKGNIYPGKNMVLTCNPPASSTGGITWSFNDNSLGSSSKYQISTDGKTLTVTSTSDQDSGKYACRTTVNSMAYIIFQTMTVQPFPNVNVNSSKTLRCDGSPITLQCCAASAYAVQWSLADSAGPLTDPTTGCNTYKDSGSIVGNCNTTDKILTFIWVVRELSGNLYSSGSVKINVTSKNLYCYNDQFGGGNLNAYATSACDADSIGNVTARCKSNLTDITKGYWAIEDTNCILRALQNLLERAKNLQAADVPQFMAELQNITETFADKITESTVNILTTVDLLNIIANVSQSFKVDKPIMTNFLKTVDVIGSKPAQNAWQKLNAGNTTEKASSALLRSTEEMGSTLTDTSFSITTNSTQLNRTKTSGLFFGTFGTNSSTQIEIPELNGLTSITTIVFTALDNVLPVRNTTYKGNQTKINGDVAAIIVNNTVYNISLTFDIKNKSLGSPQCVFWNFSLLAGIGGWDSTGCEVKPVVNQTGKFKCECNHTTSFSILMSPFFVDSLILGFITFICVGISMICLILALIIEIIVWKPLTRNDTAYMRHVSMVNIALSLLIADICFIIGAAIVNKGELTPVGPCSTATFFMHFFYLALFFWMLFSALLLLYRTIMVFSRMSKTVMMVIAFFLGYGAPLLIAVITVASTAGGGGYIQEENACWLNWNKTKAMLAFVIPALTIVAINFLVLLVVVCKMIRRGVGAATQPDEKHAIVVIARCVAILTPLFGLTWGFGIGTMVTSALGIHIVFALLNSLQGFFIFVFGILLDSKIREELVGKLSIKNFSSGQTKTTSAGVSSSSGQGQRNAYNVSNASGAPASSTYNSDTFINT
ncbi:hypothetical protein AOLI_G00029260 [Acnodon oligacanthus]